MSAVAAMATAWALVSVDNVDLRAAAQGSAPVQARLAAGELLEVRGRRLDYVQVYDHRLERAGYVKAVQVQPVDLGEANAPELLAVVRFLRGRAGAEALGIAYVAAYLRAAPAAAIGTEPFDALGDMAERLADRAARPGAAVAAQLDTVAAYGVQFSRFEQQGTVRVCYDGEAFRRVLAVPGAATPSQQARAALALTRHDCIDPALRATERQALDHWRAELLDGLAPSALLQLDEATRNRLRLRRAGVWSAIAFDEARHGRQPQPAAQRAWAELAAVNRTELTEDDATAAAEAAIRAGAVRWATAEAPAPSGRWQLRTRAGEPGQTCAQLVDTTAPSAAPLAERCTYGVVWAASARPSPDGRSFALQVQPVEAWTELWVWRRTPAGWTVDVLPPAAAEPGLGYIEFAGWGRGRKLLTAREASINGKPLRRFERWSLDTLAVEQGGGVSRWVAGFEQADAQWRRGSVSLR